MPALAVDGAVTLSTTVPAAPGAKMMLPVEGVALDVQPEGFWALTLKVLEGHPEVSLLVMLNMYCFATPAKPSEYEVGDAETVG